VKVRISVALGGQAGAPIDHFGPVVDDLDRLGFDSVWLPETFLAPTADPLVGLAYAAARVDRLKLGTHLVVPGRNVMRLARALADLDRLSGGRLLVTAVLGVDDPAERAAQGRPRGDRGAEVERVLPVLRRLWAGEEVDHIDGDVSLAGARLTTLPVQDPLEVWLGGTKPKALRRVARLGDGWLPGVISVADAVAGRAFVDKEAAGAGRAISEEHFGMNISYAHRPVGADVVAAIARRAPGVDVAEAVPVGVPALRAAIGRWVDAGFSKFVLRPVEPPGDWHAELEHLAASVLDLQRTV
jgi:probable F420-dependent oxidoreductase